MSKFFVGQRVRVVNGEFDSGPDYTGQEGRITQIVPDGWEDGEPFYGLDICPIRKDPSDGLYWGFGAEDLEPILHDGHRAGDLSFSELMDKCRAGEGVAA